MPTFKVARETLLIQGHVLDVAREPLLAALRSYDPQLYVKWNPKKRGGQGMWELRRKPEYKTLRAGRYLDTHHKGRVYVPGDVFEMEDGTTLAVPKYHETSAENHVKDFEKLTYEMVTWVAKHDLWNYGFRGKNAMHESEYMENQYLNKVEDDAHAERQYMIKQHRTEFNEFREYVLSGGDPHRLMDFWGK